MVISETHLTVDNIPLSPLDYILLIQLDIILIALWYNVLAVYSKDNLSLFC